MENISTIGLDIAKSVFQVHAISEAGEVVVRRQLKRRQVLQFFAALRPCLIGLEACATAHHWARELIKLGHEVRLMPPRYGKPYVKRNKNDAADAEAISKAGNRYLRQLLVVGALAVIRRAKQLGYTRYPWLVKLMERRSVKIAAVALANKMARIAWAMMARNEPYRAPLPA